MYLHVRDLDTKIVQYEVVIITVGNGLLHDQPNAHVEDKS